MILKDQFWLYGCLLAGAAWGHQPFESTATARLQHGRLEVVLTLSGDMAATLVRTGEVETEPTPAFASYHARLEAMAPGFLKVTGDGQPLAPQRIAGRLNQSGEPEIVYLYAAPPPGPLRFDATYLHALPPSYFGQLAVLDEDEKPVGTSLLVAEKPTAEISLGPVPSAEVAAAPPTADHSRLAWLIGGVGITAGAARWLLRRRRG